MSGRTPPPPLTVLALPQHVLTSAFEDLPHEDLRQVRLVSTDFCASAAFAVRHLSPRRVAGISLRAFPRLRSLDLSEAEDWGESFLEQLVEVRWQQGPCVLRCCGCGCPAWAHHPRGETAVASGSCCTLPPPSACPTV